MAARSLIDTDGGLQSIDQIDVGPFQLMKELSRIDRQTLDVLTLPFGIKRIKSQTAFARTARSRHHDQIAARNIQVDVLQVVDAGSANPNRMAAMRLACFDRFLGGCLIRHPNIIVMEREPFADGTVDSVGYSQTL